ncbi:MAG: hypothetical protein ACR2OX_06075 [Methyloligellaceae bacterium]
MRLIEQLEASVAGEESPFRTQLVREDVARLRKLQSLVANTASRGDFMKEGMFIGWTQADARTHQIKDAVATFLEAFFAYETGGKSPEDEDSLQSAWATFDAERMEKLIRCL